LLLWRFRNEASFFVAIFKKGVMCLKNQYQSRIRTPHTKSKKSTLPETNIYEKEIKKAFLKVKN